MSKATRRQFLKQTACLGAAVAAGALGKAGALGQSPKAEIRLGLVTYQWGKDWDLPTLVANCTKAQVLGVELRTGHAHGVEPALNAQQRQEVKKQFADSPVKLVGIGSAEEFHHPDPEKLKKAIENTKTFVVLSHDVGGTGVKVRPNDLPKGVPPEKTIAQIGNALNVIAAFAADYGQQIRLEVHGRCSPLPIIKQIMDIATHPNVGVCWNTNPQDLDEPGLEHNFNLVKGRLGATAHLKGLDVKGYPFQELMTLFVKANYHGWWLLEATSKPPDLVQAMIECKALFDQMLAKAMAGP